MTQSYRFERPIDQFLRYFEGLQSPKLKAFKKLQLWLSLSITYRGYQVL